MEINNQIIIGVLGLPIRRKGSSFEFFLTRRHNPKHKAVHNKWQVSGGGLEFGETPEQTLAREFKEELNIIPTILYPHPIVITNTWFTNSAGHGKNSHIVLLTYLVSIDNQIPEDIDPDHESNALGWFDLDQIKNLKYLPNTETILDHAIKLIPLIDKNLL